MKRRITAGFAWAALALASASIELAQGQTYRDTLGTRIPGFALMAGCPSGGGACTAPVSESNPLPVVLTGSAGFFALTVNSIGFVPYLSHAALAAAPTPAETSTIVQLGYYAPGDGGYAEYDWNPTSSLTADGVFVVLPTGQASGTAGRFILRVPGEGVHPEAAGAYCDYPIGAALGGVGTVFHDDTAALNNLASFISNSSQGQGTIVQSPTKTTACYVGSGNFLLQPGVVLAGAGDALTYTYAAAHSIVPFIALNPADSLYCQLSSRIRDLAVMRAGLAAKPANAEAALTFANTTIQDSSIGIYNNNGSCQIDRVLTIGFHKGMYSQNGGQLLVHGLYGDDWSVLEVTANGDTSDIEEVRGWPFWAFAMNGRLGVYAGTPSGGSGYGAGATVTVPGGTCTTQPAFTVVGAGTPSSLTVADSGDCTVSPQTWGGSASSTVYLAGSGGTNGTNVPLTVSQPLCAVAPVLLGTIAGNALTAITGVQTAGSCALGYWFAITTVTGGSLVGAEVNMAMAKNAIALTGGGGSGLTATISVQDYAYRGGPCLYLHDQFDGGAVRVAECEEYQVGAELSNIWNDKLFYIGGEGGLNDYDRQPIGIETLNCVRDTTIYSPNADGEVTDLLLNHKSSANGGSCGGNATANLAIVGGHLGMSPNLTSAVISTGAYSTGTISDLTLGWNSDETVPVSVQIGVNSGLWRFENLQFDVFNPTYVSQWISVDPTATPPQSNQFAPTMEGSLVVNGDFRIDQCNEGASSTGCGPNANLRADQWRFIGAGTGEAQAYVTTQTFSAFGPPGNASELKLIASTAVASPAGTSAAVLQQTIEGPALAALNWGTANTQPIVLETALNCTQAGTYNFSLQNSGGSVSYVAPIAVGVGWTYQATVIPGPTIGAWSTSPQNTGVTLSFDVNATASAITSSPNKWVSGAYFSSTGSYEIGQHAASPYCLIGYVHVRPGPFVRPYTLAHYSTELRQAQRHFQKSLAPGTAVAQAAGAAGAASGYTPFTSGNFGAPVYFGQPLEATPTVTILNTTSPNGNCYDATKASDVGAGAAVNAGAGGFLLSCSLASGAPASGDLIQAQWAADVGH